MQLEKWLHSLMRVPLAHLQNISSDRILTLSKVSNACSHELECERNITSESGKYVMSV